MSIKFNGTLVVDAIVEEHTHGIIKYDAFMVTANRTTDEVIVDYGTQGLMVLNDSQAIQLRDFLNKHIGG